MKNRALILILGVILALMWSCEKPGIPMNKGVLGFSADTVKFDSVFTTLQTPSQRLAVYNRENFTIGINRIWLENGAASEFSLIADGQEGNDLSELSIPPGDSLLIFVSLVSGLKDNFAEEALRFQVGSEVQTVLVRAFVLDAYFFKARLVLDNNSLQIQGDIIRRDTVLPTDKPIVIDGPMLVTENATLTILPGTELRFTPYKFGITDESGFQTFILFSGIIVDGRLHAEGTSDMPILFAGSRLENRYEENPAQWRGLRFSQFSQGNVLRHCEIRNGLVGLQVDSISVGIEPKVTIQHCEVRNMGAYGLFLQGFGENGPTQVNPPAVFMENSIVNTCKERTLFINGGGKYAFYNCTFANYSVLGFSRRKPQTLIANYLLTDNTAIGYPLVTDFFNCVIYGSEEEEVALDLLPGYPVDRLSFDHCLLRLGMELGPLVDPYLASSKVNEDPLFNNFFDRDYRPREGSPVIDAGTDFPQGSSGYTVDFRNRLDSARYSFFPDSSQTFDIGAWEYYPLEE